MNMATFFISTGRCGTQWIAQTLAELYPDTLRVEHEPLHNNYQSRTLLDPNSTLSPTVTDHLASIEKTLESQPYIEVGHPNWGAIPHLVRHFQSRVRIVHLTRHPVPTSYSWVTHGAYQTPFLPHLPEKILLSPFDNGVRFPEYQDNWAQLTPFDKSLFYWSEVQALALELQTTTPAPWLQLSYENLFNGDGFNQLLAFLELPPQPTTDRTDTLIDQYHYLSTDAQDWRTIAQHSQAMQLAHQLNYSMDKVDESALQRRYLGIH